MVRHGHARSGTVTHGHARSGSDRRLPKFSSIHTPPSPRHSWLHAQPRGWFTCCTRPTHASGRCTAAFQKPLWSGKQALPGHAGGQPAFACDSTAHRSPLPASHGRPSWRRKMACIRPDPGWVSVLCVPTACQGGRTRSVAVLGLTCHANPAGVGVVSGPATERERESFEGRVRVHGKKRVRNARTLLGQCCASLPGRHCRSCQSALLDDVELHRRWPSVLCPGPSCFEWPKRCTLLEQTEPIQNPRWGGSGVLTAAYA